ncbi:restriction endonuclease subunit S [Prochlorothrix hollandica]|uniref:restriction endonuclease subunit S n=1 Tax=Prochlorothrix hollandica TaxID=1223 RepID=UPI00034757E6|nr:restriction endonuclease subunit S [Prochlorothrix hollandica]
MVPKLRFPEFWDAGKWKYMELDPFFQGYSERVLADTKLPIYSSTRTGLKFQKDYYDNRELENEGEYGIVPEGYFVYRHMSDDGTFRFNINKTGGKIAVSREYPVFTTVNLDSNFLLYLLNEGESFKEFAFAQKKGGTRTRLYLNALRTWKTLLPSYPEQQKIADCLTSLDDRITTETQKLEALKTHKKGLMQQLFPAEGQTLPQLRFPQFRNTGDWEVNTLIQLAKFRRGSFPQPYGLPEWYDELNGMPFIQVFDVGDDLQLKPNTKSKISKLASKRLSGNEADK